MLTELPPLALTFDDVLLVPAESDVLPAEVSLATRIGRFSLQIPILSSAMDTVTEAAMGIAMARAGGLGVIHRNLSVEVQAAAIRAVKDEGGLLAAGALGTGAGTRERARALMDAGADALVVDTAHGHSKGVLVLVRELRDTYPDVLLIAGNVATADGTEALIQAGADAVKVGIGPGSICTTRVVAGVGVPQLSAVGACAAAAEPHGVAVIADGGIHASGDIVKALAAGAHAVMVGSLLAGTDEAPGERVTVAGRERKTYRGMGSRLAMVAGSSDRYFQSGTPQRKLVPEGVEATVPYRGGVADVLHGLLGGLRAGMGYTGSATIDDLRTRARFVRISSAGLVESRVHDVSEVPETVVDEGSAR